MRSWRPRGTKAGRTTAGPRLVDGALVLAGLALTALAVKTPWAPSPRPVIAAAGAAASVMVWWHRRRPVAVTAGGAAALALSGNPGPLYVGLFASGSTSPRRAPVIASASALGVAGLAAPALVDGTFDAVAVASAAAQVAVLVGVAVYLGTRRDLLASLHERAERAEAERVLRDARARADERTRIAREMHDVLAHKMSLIALHAGALEVNADSGPERVEQGATLIRSIAHGALDELRTVLGVLRAPAGEAEPFADLPGLVASWAGAGAPVELHDEVGPLPAPLARAVHRLVQEGLTNAHRHAPDAPVAVTVSGRTGHEVVVAVRNGPAAHPPPATATGAGAGVGLVGLAERVRLLGGTLVSGPDDSGGWLLEGRLPWTVATEAAP